MTLEQLFEFVKDRLKEQAESPHGPSLDKAMLLVVDAGECPVLSRVLEVKGELHLIIKQAPKFEASAEAKEYMASMRSLCGIPLRVA